MFRVGGKTNTPGTAPEDSSAKENQGRQAIFDLRPPEAASAVLGAGCVATGLLSMAPAKKAKPET
jgi:hypothetical protein